jgi:hypothetical protein
MNTQRPIIGQPGLGSDPLLFVFLALRAGTRSINRPQAAINTISTTNPIVHIRFCACSVKIGSNNTG